MNHVHYGISGAIIGGNITIKNCILNNVNEPFSRSTPLIQSGHITIHNSHFINNGLLRLEQLNGLELTDNTFGMFDSIHYYYHHY